MGFCFISCYWVNFEPFSSLFILFSALLFSYVLCAMILSYDKHKILKSHEISIDVSFNESQFPLGSHHLIKTSSRWKVDEFPHDAPGDVEKKVQSETFLTSLGCECKKSLFNNFLISRMHIARKCMELNSAADSSHVSSVMFDLIAISTYSIRKSLQNMDVIIEHKNLMGN